MLILLVRANALRRRPPTIPPPRRQTHHCHTNASSGTDTKAAGAPKATTAATPTTATSDKANGHPHRHRNHRYNWHASPGRIRSHRDSPKAASTEVLISPPRPRYIIAALGSSSRYVGGFLHATMRKQLTTQEQVARGSSCYGKKVTTDSPCDLARQCCIADT
jgi:hypothetical protein